MLNVEKPDLPLYSVGYASGVFDMFHVGHLRLLQRARQCCVRLVVGVASDEYVEQFKGDRPVIPLDERLEIVAALAIVDQVAVDGHENKQHAWSLLRFDVIFKGDDWRGAPKGLKLEADMSKLGVDVVYFPYTAETSSTMLRARIQHHKWL